VKWEVERKSCVTNVNVKYRLIVMRHRIWDDDYERYTRCRLSSLLF